MELARDEAKPALVNYNVGIGSGEEYLLLQLRDDDTHGCRVRADVHPEEWPDSVSRVIFDQFVYDRDGQEVVTMPLPELPDGYYDLNLFMWDVGGGHNEMGAVTYEVGGTAGLDGEWGRASVRLEPGFPNPADGSLEWRLRTALNEKVSLLIVAVDGKVVRTWKEQTTQASSTLVRWDGRDGAGRKVAAGKYFLVAQLGGTTAARSSAVIVR